MVGHAGGSRMVVMSFDCSRGFGGCKRVETGGNDFARAGRGDCRDWTACGFALLWHGLLALLWHGLLTAPLASTAGLPVPPEAGDLRSRLWHGQETVPQQGSGDRATTGCQW